MSNAEYVQANLADARARREAARARFKTARSAKDRRMASEDIEFYGNRAAYLAKWLEKGN